MAVNEEHHVLLVEDEEAIATMVKFGLKAHGYIIHHAENVDRALDILSEEKVELILLDWMLEEVDGIEFLKTVRNHESYNTLPVIMLTARSMESDKIKGLDTGADDFVTKPFSLNELKSRIRALLRRANRASNISGEQEVGHSHALLQNGQLTIDLEAVEIRLNEQLVTLGPLEFKVLVYFMENLGRVYSRAQLLDSVWGQNSFVEERTVDVTIRRIRKALSEFTDQDIIVTVRGMGYKMVKMV